MENNAEYYVDAVTPFTDCDSIDWGGVRRNMEYFAKNGVKNVFLAGNTGECFALTPLEHDLLLRKGTVYANELGINIITDLKNMSAAKETKKVKSSKMNMFSNAANIFPHVVPLLVESKSNRDMIRVAEIYESMIPFFTIVETERLAREESYRNFSSLVVIKMAMAVLGMPAGNPRRQEPKIKRAVAKELRATLLKMIKESFWLFQPIEDFYEVEVEERVRCHKVWKMLSD